MLHCAWCMYAHITELCPCLKQGSPYVCVRFNLLENTAGLFVLSVWSLYSVSIPVLAFRLCMNSRVGQCT